MKNILKSDKECVIAYEALCDFELFKKGKNIEKLASIVQQADNNGVILNDITIYKKVGNYYNSKGEKELANKYLSIYNNISNTMDEEFCFDENVDLK